MVIITENKFTRRFAGQIKKNKAKNEFVTNLVIQVSFS